MRASRVFSVRLVLCPALLMTAIRPRLSAALCLALLLGCDGGTQPDVVRAGTAVGPEGGTVSVEGLTLEIPPGALSEEVSITLEEISLGAGGIPAGFLALDGTVFDLGPDGLRFDEPVALTLRYSAGDVPAGVAESELRMLHLDGGVAVLESTIDRTSRTVTAYVEHFSGVGIGLEVGALTRVACPALIPAATAGVPLDRISLGSLPTDFEPPFAAVITTDDDLVQTYALVVDAEAGGLEMVVPVHPSTDPAGGTVRVNVTDGTQACAAMDFAVEALPAATGELAAIADAFQVLIDAQAAGLETTAEALRTTPVADLPTGLVPLALLQSIVDHPANDRSLRALADGTSPDAAAARLDLVEPLLSRTGIRASLEGATVGLPAAARSVGRGPLAAGPAPVSAATCLPDVIGNDPGLLDACMWTAVGAQVELGGASGKVLTDIGTATGVLGLVPGLGTPTAIGGAVAWGALSQKGRTAALLPSVLTGITVSYGAEQYREDEDGPGTWSATVTAANQGYDLGKEALEAMLQGAGVAGLADSYQVGGAEVNNILGAALTGPVAGELLNGGTVEEFQIPVETFGPVNVSAEQWSQVEIFGDAFVVGTHNTYEPRAAGTAILSVKTKDGAFGGNQLTWQGDLEVLQLDIDILPAEVNLGPGEPQGFTVVVSNAIQPDQWEILPTDPFQGSVGDITLLSEGRYLIDYTAPGTPDPSRVDILAVRSTAAAGARAYSTEERTASATIRFGEIVITPDAACLEPNGSIDFSSEVRGLLDDGVEWSADVGTIDPVTGNYTAPASIPEGGVATITATSTAVAGVTERVYVQIVGCTCNW